jgi:acyl dehydratase
MVRPRVRRVVQRDRIGAARYPCRRGATRAASYRIAGDGERSRMSTSPEFRFYWEDFPVGSQREFGGVRVEEAEMVEFARRFDPQRFHLDEEAARRTPFGGLVASGWYTCSLAMRMSCDAYLLQTASVGSPGVEQLRWVRPVRAGDTLRLRLTVLAARPLASRPGVGLLRNRWEVLDQRDELVMELEALAMIQRRPA